MRMLPLAALMVLLCTAARAANVAVYTQPPSGAGGVAKSSWYPPDGLDGDAYSWDNFTLPITQAVTEIQWRGGYTNSLSGAGVSPVYAFTISIYASIAAGIQPDVIAPPLVQYDVNNNCGETLVGTIGGAAMYDYHYVLPSPFQAVAGTKYWVQIEAWQGVTPTYGWPPDWGLAYGSGGDGGFFREIIGGSMAGGNMYYAASGDLAFTLLTTGGTSYTVNAGVSPSGTGTVSGAGSYPSGTTATLTAAPNAGYGFVRWTENGATVSTSATYVFTVNANRTLTANFTPAYTVTTSAAPSYGGKTSGDGTYNSGASVTVTATPFTGYTFANWTEFGTVVSTSTKFVFTAAANRTLVANFNSAATTATFDFDSGTPLVTTGQSTPFDQTVNGITAHFSSPSDGVYTAGGAYSVQTDGSTQFRMSQFSGHYLYPDSVYKAFLDIQFSRHLNSIRLTFATADFQQVEIPSTLTLTAYEDSIGSTPIGSASAHGTYAGDTMPMGTLSFSSTKAFDLVRIGLPYLANGASDFLVDNIVVTAVPTGPGVGLKFSAQPTNTAAGSPISPAVKVEVVDAAGNIVPGATDNIAVTLGANPAGGALFGTRVATAVGGTATFSGLSINKAGAGYTLLASANGLAGATSAAFSIAAGAPSKLAFSVQPANTTGGATLTPAVKVQVQDRFGNLVTSPATTVAVALGTNPAGGTLSGTKSATTSGGVATFSALKIDKAGTGYTLRAAATGLSSATSAPFNVAVGKPAKLVLTVQPANTSAGATITPAVQVTILDAGGNLVTTATNSVTLALGTNPSGGALYGTKTVYASQGVATFSSLRINTAAAGYTLAASATGLAGATSARFTISPGPPYKLAFSPQPAGTTGGALFIVKVLVLDRYGNVSPSPAATVNLSIASNPVGGTLSGTKSVASSSGKATFTGMSINKAGAGYKLRASATGLYSATSAAFDVTVGPAYKLVFTASPAGGTVGMALPAVVAAAQDRGGNLVSAAVGNVTVALSTNPTAAALGGTRTQALAGGLAAFNDLTVSRAGTGYVLKAYCTGLVSAYTGAFAITP